MVIDGAVTKIRRGGGKSIPVTVLIDWCSFGESAAIISYLLNINNTAIYSWQK